MRLRLAALTCAAALLAAVTSGGAAEDAVAARRRFRPERIEAATLGRVDSRVVRALKRALGRQLVIDHRDRTDELSRYDVIVVDGDVTSPQTLRVNSEIVGGAADGQWILAVDLSRPDARALRRHTGFLRKERAARGADAFLFRREVTPEGWHEVRIVDAPAGAAGAKATPRARRRCRFVAQVLETELTEDLIAGEGAAGTGVVQAAGQGPPPELLHVRWRYTEARSMKVAAPSCKNTGVGCRDINGSQTPNWTVNYTYTAYLDNQDASVRPQGNYQWVELQADIGAAPLLSGEKFAGTKPDGSAYGLWGGRLVLELHSPYRSYQPSTARIMDLIRSEPHTVNRTNKYTVTTATTFGFSAGVKLTGDDGSGGRGGTSFNAEWSHSESREYDVPDWNLDQTGAVGDDGGVSWRFYTSKCQANDVPDSTEVKKTKFCAEGGLCGYKRTCCRRYAFEETPFIDWDRGGCFTGNPAEPNALSKTTAKFGVLALWRSRDLVTGPVTFPSEVRYTLVSSACNNYFLVCNSKQIATRTVGTGLINHELDLSAVIPVGVKSLTFYREADLTRVTNAQDLESVTDVGVPGGTTLIGVVTLQKDAPADLVIPLDTNAPGIVNVPTTVNIAKRTGSKKLACLDDYREALRKDRSAQPSNGCFKVFTSKPQSDPGEVTATVQAFYGTAIREAITVTR